MNLSLAPFDKISRQPSEESSGSQPSWLGEEGGIQSNSSEEGESSDFPRVPRLPPPQGIPPHITGEVPEDRGGEELLPLIEVWTTNHQNSQGDPCDGCAECLGTERLQLLVHQFHERTRQYQALETTLGREEDRIEAEAARQEREQLRARNPLAQELEVQNRGKYRESVRLRALFKEERRNIDRELQRSYSELKGKADSDLQTARERYESEVQTLEARHRALTEDLAVRLATLESQQRRAREAFKAAAEVEKTILQTRVSTALEELERARVEAQQLCPHPTPETLKDILNRWPEQGGIPKTGNLRCRVCHKLLTREQLEENVRRGGNSLTYSPAPVCSARPGGKGGPGAGGGGTSPTHTSDPTTGPRGGGGGRGPTMALGTVGPKNEDGPPEPGRASGGASGGASEGRTLKRAREEEGGDPREEGSIPSQRGTDSQREGAQGGEGYRRGAGGNGGDGSPHPPESPESL